MGYYSTIEIDSFFSELVQYDIIEKELVNAFGDEVTQGIIQKMTIGVSGLDIQVDFEDVIIDCVENHSTIITTLNGFGDYGEFPIRILQFGPLFWVEAQEFDSIKYFNSAEDAIACAEIEYDSFLNGDSEEV
jgi:hypothetical protein